MQVSCDLAASPLKGTAWVPNYADRLCLVALPYAMCAARLATAAAQSTVYTFSARPLTGGEPLSLGSLRGKVLLIENVASL